MGDAAGSAPLLVFAHPSPRRLATRVSVDAVTQWLSEPVILVAERKDTSCDHVIRGQLD